MLKQNILSNYRSKKAVLAFIICILLISLNCGKRKAPLPPVEKTSQRSKISGTQRGNAVTLSWILPDQNVSDKSVLNIIRTDIYRLAEPSTAPLTLSEEEFASRSTLIATVPISESDFTNKQLTYTDILQFAGQQARLRYAIRFVNESGQKAAFSNFLLIEPTAKVASNPTSLSASVSQEAINLKWDAPFSNVDGSRPPNIVGYNIYRMSQADTEAKILNRTPVIENNFYDIFFEFNINYRYFVRTVSLGTDSVPVESLDSNMLEIKPSDTFAPSAPSAITIAAAPNNISIFFAVNPEKDIAGYKLYRSLNSNQTKSEWTLLTPELLTVNTFQDNSVESGKTYYYYLAAVDKAGNISEPSEIISETAP